MRRTRRTQAGLLVATVALPAVLLGCSSDTTASTSTADSTTTTSTIAVNAGATVAITAGTTSKFAFDPDPVTVKVGQTLTWKNDSGSSHTVTADPGQAVSFKSQTVRSGETYVNTFDKPGTYTYFCSIHTKESMSGSVVVTAA